MEDLTGKQLGPYRIEGPLGEGGMAAVYKAYQPAMDRYVALKILPRHFASDPQFTARFDQEARIIAKLQHVHILPVHDYGQAEGYTYIVMPFISTGTLADLIREGPVPLERVRSIISQVGEALAYAHKHGVIHRDVKPSNVLIDDQGYCRLTDFGISKMVEGSQHLTQTGAMAGTPAYMSPEQIQGEILDGRSDLYSLGVVLYEMVTGKQPYRAETPAAVLVKHLHDPLPSPRSIQPDLSIGLEQAILTSLAKSKDERFANAGEFVRAVQTAVAEVQATAPTAASAPPEGKKTLVAQPRPEATLAAKPPRRLPWGLIAAGAGLVVVVGFVAVGASLLRGRQAEEAPTPEAATQAPRVGLATATLRPIASPNLALGRPATASRSMPDQPPEQAVDDDGDTLWGAGEGPPQFIEIDLGAPTTIARILLTAGQYPGGATVHQIWVRGPGESLRQVHEFRGNTRDSQVLQFAPSTPLTGVQFVRILTIASPSWVAWKEVEVYGEDG